MNVLGHSTPGVPEPNTLCPTCKQRVRAPKEKREAARPRSKWIVAPPDDMENGAEVLDTLVAQAAEKTGREQGEMKDTVFRYFVLAEVLAVFVRDAA